MSNPNEPIYVGGTDNPGDNTATPGGPTSLASTETAPLTLNGSSLTASVERHPPLPPGVAQAGTDTILPAGEEAVEPLGLTQADISLVDVATGWTLLPDSVAWLDQDDTNFLNLRFAFEAHAAALAATLPRIGWPIGDDVISDNGLFTISAEDGTVTYSGDTTDADAGPVICEVRGGYDPWSRW